MYTPRVVLDRYHCLFMGPQLAPTRAERVQACSLTRFFSLSLSFSAPSVALSKLLQFLVFVLNLVYIYRKQPIRRKRGAKGIGCASLSHACGTLLSVCPFEHVFLLFRSVLFRLAILMLLRAGILPLLGFSFLFAFFLLLSVEPFGA